MHAVSINVIDKKATRIKAGLRADSLIRANLLTVKLEFAQVFNCISTK